MERRDYIQIEEWCIFITNQDLSFASCHSGLKSYILGRILSFNYMTKITKKCAKRKLISISQTNISTQKNKHEIEEINVVLIASLTVFANSFAALVEITPLMFQDDTTKPVEGLRPLNALEMEGRDIYVREGCDNCHSQMIRPFRAFNLTSRNLYG